MCFLQNFMMSKVSLVLFIFLLFVGYEMVFANEVILTSMHDYVLTPCEDEYDCEHIPNATCISNICKCNDSKICIDKDRNSRVVTEIGKPCQHDTDCNIQYSECSEEKLCACRSGRIKSTDARKCLVISEGIEGSCEDSVQCYTKTQFSICQENKCLCQQQMHAHNGSCYKNVDLNQFCKHDAECSLTLLTECKNLECTCQEGYVANSVNTLCLPVVSSFGAPCVEDAQCSKTFGGAAQCTGGFCGCRDLYQLKEKTQKCVREMLLGEICMRHLDCHSPLPGPRRLECILGVCKCKSYYVEEHGYCVNKGSGRESEKFFTVTLFILMSFCVILGKDVGMYFV